MLESALIFIRRKLDQYLINCFSLSESVTALNQLVGQDGAFPQKNQNKIVITLINLEHETAKQYYGGQKSLGSDGFGRINPAIRFNLDLLFTASFDDYEESLKLLGETIAFFQANQSFNRQTMPDMPDGISMLSFEVESISYFETHNLWSAMGAKYMPSVIYKVRHVTIQTDQITGVVSPVSDVSSQVVA
jgi:hypothetical protein